MPPGRLPAAIPSFGDLIELNHYGVEFQYALGERVGDLRWDRRFVMTMHPSLGFEHSQALGQGLGRDRSQPPPQFAESLWPFHVQPVEEQQSPGAGEDVQQPGEWLVGVVWVRFFWAAHSFYM